MPFAPRRLVSRAALTVVCTVIALAASGCAYNGLYNARTASRRADLLLQRGMDDSAAVYLQRASDAAEAVLERADDSTEQGEALLLSGRALALSGADCVRARNRLNAFLSLGGTTADDRARAALAIAQCDARSEQWDLVEARLAPIDAAASGLTDERLRSDVRRWRARAALASGASARADSLLSTMDVDDAPWERIAVAIERQAWEYAEGQMVGRALRGDARPELDAALRRAAAARQFVMVARVVNAFDSSSAPRAVRVRLRMLAGELEEASGDTARARMHYQQVIARTALDTLARRAASARLAQLDAAQIDSVPALRAHLLRSAPLARGTGAYDRFEASATLFLLLHDTVDPSGAALFLAGEVARDSLRLPSLAIEAWRTLERRYPDAPLLPRALYAASRLMPDSASAMQRTLITRFPDSALSAWLRGESVVGAPDKRATDALLEGRWTIAARALPDSLRALRERVTPGSVPGRP